MFKLQITLDRRNARQKLNYCLLSDPPNFSLQSTFKHITNCIFLEAFSCSLRNPSEDDLPILRTREGNSMYYTSQCGGSMTFWCGSGSGSADPCLWLIDPDPDSDSDPAIVIIDLQDANKKLILIKFFCILLFEGTFTSFFKDRKVKKKS